MSRRITLEPRYTAGGAFFVIEGDLITDLDPAELASLVRQAAALDSTVGGPYEPPYVIAAELPYSDVDNDQQTPAYTWAVRFTDREVADAALAACRVELARVGVWWARSSLVRPVVPALLAVPEQRFEVGELAECGTVGAAIAALRVVLLTHADAPIAANAAFSGGYWLRSGLAQGQVAAIMRALRDDPFDELIALDPCEVDASSLVEALATYITDGAVAGPEAPPRLGPGVVAVLERWVAGEDLTGGAWSG